MPAPETGFIIEVYVHKSHLAVFYPEDGRDLQKNQPDGALG